MSVVPFLTFASTKSAAFFPKYLSTLEAVIAKLSTKNDLSVSLYVNAEDSFPYPFVDSVVKPSSVGFAEPSIKFLASIKKPPT